MIEGQRPVHCVGLISKYGIQRQGEINLICFVVLLSLLWCYRFLKFKYTVVFGLFGLFYYLA